MFRELKDNNRGIIFVTVLIIIMVAMVLAVTVLSLNISQVKSSEDELRHIQARILSEGGLAQMLVSKFSGTPVNLITYTETLGNTTFTIVANIDTTGASPIGSNSIPLDIDVTF
ncbi:MAG: hypothetical protein KAR31_01065 [Candidatus Omnitrophica bacterium]|nr:hypothetical protein [Candidatus Omnitrophota bacterium]